MRYTLNYVKSMEKRRKIIAIKATFVMLSIALAVFFARSSFLKSLLIATQGTKIIGSFIAGIFVASGFTAMPALVALAQIAQHNSIIQTALIGGLGAFLGDFLLFLLIKHHIVQACTQALANIKSAKIERLLQSKIFKPLMATLGACVIASPFPDEIGLTLMGISQLNTLTFFFIIFPIQASSIFILGLLARNT